MPDTIRTDAVVLRSRPYGETDRIVVFFGREVGKFTGIAKGAKNSRRRFAGSLETLAGIRVFFRTKPGASLAFVERCELLRPSLPLAAPSRFPYASYVAELTDRMTPERDPLPHVYELLDTTLRTLETSPATPSFLRAFELRLLRALGLAPDPDSCGHCHRPLAPEEEAALRVDSFLLVCPGCSRGNAGERRLGSASRAAVGRLLQGALAEVARLRFPPEVSEDLSALTGALLGPHLTRPLASLGWIRSLASPSPSLPRG
ncbi:MAG: hypothetical protein KatS3mg076_1134 [Candidatus Binatia bacterium]|nr:MAG: hypothetical protein KatS3mg076_1134 [Candidatus Binatia bacterium]